MRILLLTLVTLLTFLGRNTYAVEIPTTAFVDGISIGDVVANIEDQQVTSVRKDTFLKLVKLYIKDEKLQRLKFITMNNAEYVEIKELERIGISAKYDDKNLKIDFGVPLEFRVVQDFPVLLNKKQAGLSLSEGDFSGYLNLRGSVGYEDTSTVTTSQFDKTPANGQLELIQNFKYFTFESTAQYQEFDAKPLNRQDTSIVSDIENQKIRIRAGDFVPGVIGFQSSIAAAGLQVQKQFNIYPNRSAYNKRSTTIEVKKNSLMEIYVNENLVSRLRVNVGPYNLKELPLLYGQNKVKVVLKDDFGGTETFEVELMFDDQILAEGVHDFSYQVGNPSYLISNEKNYYSDLYGSFFHKYGVTDQTNIMVNFESYKNTSIGGAGLGYLSKYGTSFFDAAYSTDQVLMTYGNAAKFKHSTADIKSGAFKDFRALANVEWRSKDFSTLTALAPSIPNFSNRYDLVVQKKLDDVSVAGLGLTHTKGQNLGTDDTNRRLNYQRQFRKGWRFDVSYNWSDQRPQDEQIQLTLNWTEPEARAQAALSHDTLDNTTSLRYTKNNLQNYNDVQLDLFASKNKNRFSGVETQNATMSANYFATKYEARLQLGNYSSQGIQTRSSQLGLGTAIAWAPGAWGFSRPISDSFAIISPEGLLPGQVITIPNGVERDSLVLKRRENFIYSNLTSYVDRPIQLDSTGLGAAYRLDRESYLVSPKYRTGVYVPLKLYKSVIVRGQLTGADAEATRYLSGRVLTEDGKVFSDNFFTDESGNFIIEGLSYGKYQIVVSVKGAAPIWFQIEDENPEANAAQQKQDSESLEYELGVLKIEKEAVK